jgi:glycosyltransferase involved in cell wall biosynthesis
VSRTSVPDLLATPADPQASHAGNHFAEPSPVPVVSPTPIAVVLTSFEPGGTERQMIELIRRLPRSRWLVHVACLHARGRWQERVEEVAASVAEFPIHGFRRPDTCRQGLSFARWCTQHRIALVHTADFYSNVFALPSAAVARVPVRVGNRRGFYFELSRAHRAMQRASFACAHAVIANSSATAGQLRVERVPDRKISIVPNGLDVDLFGIPRRHGRRRVIAVANLRPEKGHEVLVDAAEHVVTRFPDAHFTLVGDGPLRPAIESRLNAKGLTRAFSLLGERDDVPELLSNADIAVLPSRSESLPNAVLEAMASALPVVASQVGGVSDVIEHRRTGFLVPAGDSQALAERLCELMSDPLSAARVGLAARDEVKQRYSFDRMVTAIEGLYFRELARRGVIRAEQAA